MRAKFTSFVESPLDFCCEQTMAGAGRARLVGYGLIASAREHDQSDTNNQQRRIKP